MSIDAKKLMMHIYPQLSEIAKDGNLCGKDKDFIEDLGVVLNLLGLLNNKE